MSRRFCVSRSSDCSLTRAVTVSLLADLVRLQSVDLNVVFFTQNGLLTLQIAAPHGITVSSNVATVETCHEICFSWRGRIFGRGEST